MFRVAGEHAWRASLLNKKKELIGVDFVKSRPIMPIHDFGAVLAKQYVGL